jgi:hypothetical protein
VLVGIAAVVVSGIGLRLWTIDTYSNEAPPTLEFEIRLPATMAVPDRSGVRIELHTDRYVGESYLAEPWQRYVADDGTVTHAQLDISGETVMSGWAWPRSERAAGG